MINTYAIRRAQPRCWLVVGASLLLVALCGATAEGSDTSTISNSSDGSSYILVSGDSAVGLGALEDLSTARDLRDTAGEEFLWARRNGKTWIVRDAAVLSQAHQALDVKRHLAEGQEALGTDQRSLGEQQSELGNRQLAIAKEQRELERQSDDLKAQIANASRQQKADLETKLRAVKEKHRELDSQQSELGRQQAELGKQQAELGQKQGALGRKHGENAKDAEPRLRALLDDAIGKGLAQEVTQ